MWPLLIGYQFSIVVLASSDSRAGEWDFGQMTWTIPNHKTKHGGEVIRPIPKKALPYLKQFFQFPKLMRYSHQLN